MHYPADSNRRRIAAFPSLDSSDAPPILFGGLSPDSLGGRAPLKRVCGEELRVEADIFAPTGSVAVSLNWRRRGTTLWESIPMLPLTEKGVRHGATLTFPQVEMFEFAIGVRFPNGAATILNEPPEMVIVERPEAARGAWAELSAFDLKECRLAGAAPLLDSLSASGFDFVALPSLATAIDPAMGSLEDFDPFLRMANQRGLEIAITPQLETRDFYHNEDWHGMLERAWTVLRFWAARGIRAFRMDAETISTTPPGFWQKLLATARSQYPDLIFTCDPGDSTDWKSWIALAKTGFSSIHLPIGAGDKSGLKKSIHELAQPEIRDVLRATLWPSMLPDRPCVRATLALALSASFGIPANLGINDAFLKKLNQLRRQHSALLENCATTVCHCRDQNIIALLKAHPGGNHILIVALIEGNSREAQIQFPRATAMTRLTMRDLFTDHCYGWRGTDHRVSLDAQDSPVRIFQIEADRVRA